MKKFNFIAAIIWLIIAVIYSFKDGKIQSELIFCTVSISHLILGVSDIILDKIDSKWLKKSK